MIFIFFFLFHFVHPFEIEDCCCTSETIDEENKTELYDLLSSLKNTIFFRLYQVALEKECTHFVNNPICSSESCVVHQCCEEEVPEKWWSQMDGNLQSPMEDEVNMEWSFAQTTETWPDMDEDQWIMANLQSDVMSFVDLSNNPDGYTGYKGKEASKIWSAIFEANCFQGSQTCMEERTFFRLISGFRTLTTALVFSNFPNENGVWGPSLKFYTKLLHGKDEFINNLYFGYVFLLRALNKAAPLLKSYPIDSGNPQEDFRAKKLFDSLLDSDFIQSTCTPEFSFDESALFQGDKYHYKDMFRRAFRNISTILDCVGCEKCKLHAKIEFHGLGTALKILFSNSALTADNADFLERNEVVALIGALTKYADAIRYITSMRELYDKNKEDEKTRLMLELAISTCVGLFTILMASVYFRPKEETSKKL